MIVNDSDTAVVVNIVDGTEVAVESGHRKDVTMDACLGTAVVVIAQGHPDVEMRGAACAGTVLYVRKDHSAYIKVFGG